MRFWDSSVIVPLIAWEESSSACLDLLRSNPFDIVVWWGSVLECVSSVCRKEREGSLSADQSAAAISRLKQLAESWTEVEPVEKVRKIAARLLRVHPIRAADALQLSAAWQICGDEPSIVEFLTADGRLYEAAAREGFQARRIGAAPPR